MQLKIYKKLQALKLYKTIMQGAWKCIATLSLLHNANPKQMVISYNPKNSLIFHTISCVSNLSLRSVIAINYPEDPLISLLSLMAGHHAYLI